MEQLEVGIIGTGWCGGIRAVATANSPMVERLHVCDIDAERLGDIEAQTGAVSSTEDYMDIVRNASIEAIMISSTPESNHYPIAKAALEAGKHVLLEKPISLYPAEADELIEIAEKNNLKFTIGYSQRFNGKQSFVKRQFESGAMGDPVSMLISRNVTRKLGNKIGGRVTLSPASMEATHDIDFAFWCLAPRKPVRVYAQAADGVLKDEHDIVDYMMMLITMDDGSIVTVGAGWNQPPGYHGYSGAYIEAVGTDASIFIDDSHKEVAMNSMANGIEYPMSSMPGEQVGHVFVGAMAAETLHFLEAVMLDRPVMVEPRDAKLVMDTYIAADLSAEINQVVDLPMTPEIAERALAASVKEK